MEFIMELNNMIISHDKNYQFVHKIENNSQITNRIT